MSRMNVKRVFLATAAAGALWAGMAIAPASATPVAPNMVNGLNILSDDSGEYLIKGAGNLLPTTVEQGDRLRGIADMNKLTNSAFPLGLNVGGSGTVNELSAIFDITVVKKSTAGGALAGGGICPFAFCFEFGPTAGFAAQMAAEGFALSPGAMLALFEGNPNNFDRAILTDANLGNGTPPTDSTPASLLADRASMEATVTDGTPFWLFGDPTGAGFWLGGSFVTDDISAANASAFNTPFGTFSFGLSLLDYVGGPPLLPETCNDTTAAGAPIIMVEVCGNGLLRSKGPTDGGPGGLITHENSAMDSFDDVNLNVTVFVPEPTTLSLFGIGLFGLGFLYRRRNKKLAA